MLFLARYGLVENTEKASFHLLDVPRNTKTLGS